MGCGMEVPHLQFTEQPDSYHLDASEYQNSGNYEDRTMKQHYILPGKDFQEQKPERHRRSDGHTESSYRAEEVQRPRHIAKQKANG